MDSDPPDTPLISIILSDEQPVQVDVERIAGIARRTALSEGAAGEISITLVDAGRMAALNAEHMGKAGPTDVLSFPIDGFSTHAVPGGPPLLIGELVLCPEVASGQAAGGFAEELDLLTAHGVLHLLGYDHDTEVHAESMRAREQSLTGRSGARAS